MSLEDDLAKLERQVNNFSIAGAAGNFHTGFSIGDDARGSGAGVHRARVGPTPEDRISFLEQSFKNFTIRGGHDISVTGSLVAGGFAISAKAAPSGEGTGGGGPGPTPTGACCMLDNSCNILTSDDCATMGGTYQGDSTVCDPNPCGATGPSCCYPDGHCADGVSEADCIAAGGASFGIFPVTNCAAQGDTPCCIVFHVTSHITGDICRQDTCNVASCTQSIDLTASFDTFLQNSGNGCCGDLLTSNPIEIDAIGYHGILTLTATDNFDGTYELDIGWEITVDDCVIVTTGSTHSTLNCNDNQSFSDSTEFCSPCIDCTGEGCDCQCPQGDCPGGSACGTYYNFSIETSIST